MKISEAVKIAGEKFLKSGISEPFREANSIVALAIGRDRVFLISDPDYELNEDEETSFLELSDRRAKREPFQHLKGTQEFFGLDFEVSPDVLIPRPETEIVVENAIAILSKLANPTFCEIGIGSGCISVSVLNKIKNATAIGLDISESALKIAKNNSVRHAVTERLKLLRSDVFEIFEQEIGEGFSARFDLIVSNPPYIPLSDFENLQPEVRDFDPKIALTDGKDGLSIIEKIVISSPKFLKPGGSLILEIGIGQETAVKTMFEAEVWKSIEVISDIQGIPRTVIARAKS